MRRTRVAVFGSTGSVGRAALDVIARLPDRFVLTALAARRSATALAAQARRFGPRRVVLSEAQAGREFQRAAGRTRSAWGRAVLVDLARSPDVDTVIMAMSGSDGLLPVLAALREGKRVALATKELLVGFGEHILATARRHRGEVLPVDSELAALHQCLDGRSADSIARLILTASGGPFRHAGPPARVGISEVLRHPTWRMGPKITVDSATLMNKGLEVIEAARLFGVAPGRIAVLIHPQSVVHSLVELTDGSVLAQLSQPDMRLPIQYCLTYPERTSSPVRRLDLAHLARLDFHAPDARRFPCLELAGRALRRGGDAPCVLVAADQIAVEAFLAGQVALRAIPTIIERTLTACASRRRGARPTVRQLVAAQARAAAYALRQVQLHGRRRSATKGV